jgi:hypothetical protein
MRSTYNKDSLSVFQSHMSNKLLRLDDIEHHLDITKSMHAYKHQFDYFLINGLDYDNVLQYYHIVLRLNRTFDKP